MSIKTTSMRADIFEKPTQCNQSELIEALTCPWCGEAPTLEETNGIYRLRCQPKGFCPVEPKLGGTWADPNKAIEEWNKRAG